MPTWPKFQSRGVLSSVFLLGIIVSAIPMAFANVVHGGACPTAHMVDRFSPYEGVTPPYRLRNDVASLIPPGAVIRHLGSGPGGGDVYRVTEKSGLEFSLKAYRSETRMREDVIRLSALKSALAKLKEINPDRERFGLIEAQTFPPQVLKMNYVRGQTLASLLSENSPLSPVERQELEHRYQACLHDLRLVILPPGSTLQSGETGRVIELPAGLPYNGLLLFLQKTNIIVDPQTLAMTIIDPA